jgi:DNA-binding transcriptional MocR family regulator
MAGETCGARCRIETGDQRRNRLNSVAAAYLSQGAVRRPEQLVFTGNGRQSIAAALLQSTERPLRRELTYPFIKGIAARLGISLVPLAMDEERRTADSVQRRVGPSRPSTSSR